jgi:hypothetical protein
MLVNASSGCSAYSGGGLELFTLFGDFQLPETRLELPEPLFLCWCTEGTRVRSDVWYRNEAFCIKLN